MLSPFRLIICFVPVSIAVWLLLPQLNTDFLPKERSSLLTVSFTLSNSNPDIVEQQVTSVLEGALSQLRQLKNISSVSDYNRGIVKLYFDRSTNMQIKRFEILAIIRQLYPQLPPNTSYPFIEGGDNESTALSSPLLSYSINAPLQPYKIKQTAETIFKKAFLNVAGIKEVNISGAESFNICIYFNKDRCRALQIDPSRIGATIQEYFSTSYPGYYINNGKQYFIKVTGDRPSIILLQNMLLSAGGSGKVLLKDVAKVYMIEEPPSYYYRINGKNSVLLNLYAQDKENKIVLGKVIRHITDAASHLLPAGYEVKLEHDDTEFLQEEINKSYRRIAFSVIILLTFISLTYRNVRYTVTLFITLAASVCLTFLFIWLFHIALHMYTLAGMAISFGIIIDNAIVMLDHYHRTRNKSIFMALLASNVITISALCLIFLLPAEKQSNLIDFSIVIILTLVSSLISTLWVTPALYELLFTNSYSTTCLRPRLQWSGSRLLMVYIGSWYYAIIKNIARYKKIFVLSLVFSFGIPVFLLPPTWEGNHWYNRWYNKLFNNKQFKENIRPQLDSWTGGALYRFVQTAYNESGYSNPEKTKLFINAELPYGNTPDQMNYILGSFEKYLAGIPGIDKYITSVSSGQSGNIEITFKENEETSSLPHQVKSWIMERITDWGGVKWHIYGVGRGFSNTPSNGIPGYIVKMKGYNYDELEKQAIALSEKLQLNKRVDRVDINGSVNFSDKRTQEYVLQLDNTGMVVHNANKELVISKLQEMAIGSTAATQVIIDDRFYPVFIMEAGSAQFSNYDLLQGYMQTDSSGITRIKDFGNITLQHLSSRIYKENRQYIRMVSLDYMGSDYFGKKFIKKAVREMQLQLPVGYTAVYDSGEINWENDLIQYSLIGLLMLSIFFLCSILFENLLQSLSIIVVIPVSFIGVFLIFSQGHYYMDQGGYASFVLLSGLVTNAGLFIINDYNRKKKSHPFFFEQNILLIRSIMRRARTILLTVLSTCCGLLPFIIEGSKDIFWFSLAIGTIGGLVFSLIAIFIVLPVLLWKKQ